jgi:hypothetical protein
MDYLPLLRFEAGVERLLDLGLVRANFASDENKYHYYFTHMGNLVVKKLGIR